MFLISAGTGLALMVEVEMLALAKMSRDAGPEGVGWRSGRHCRHGYRDRGIRIGFGERTVIMTGGKSVRSCMCLGFASSFRTSADDDE